MSLVSGQCAMDSVPDLLTKAVHSFRTRFDCKPTHAACAPGRVNLIGEHTDYNDGFVFPMALPMVTVVVGRLTSHGTCRIVTNADVQSSNYTEFPLPESTADSVERLKSDWVNYVAGVAALYPGKKSCFDAAITSSVPLGSGLSSSAALEVATFYLLEAFHDLKVEPREKALICQKAEHVYAGVPCGIMDQFISVMAKQGHALLIDCRSLECTSVPLRDDRVVIMITNSNVKHELGSSQYPIRREQCEQAASIMSKKSLRDATLQDLKEHAEKMDDVITRRARHVITEIGRCRNAVTALNDHDYDTFGRLMTESHNSLRDDYDVSCPELDHLVEAALEMKGVVLGSRMTGGGFGGCTVSMVTADGVADTIAHISKRYAGTATFYVCTPAEGARHLDIDTT